MLRHDYNNCAKYLTYNLQNKREKNKDVCDEPLFSNVNKKLWSVDTIRTLVALHDNYEPNPLIIETVTEKEIKEENEFLTFFYNGLFLVQKNRVTLFDFGTISLIMVTKILR